MKRSVKNVFYFAFFVAMAVMCFSFSSGALVWGNYEYTFSGNKVTITKYTGDAATVKIPAEINAVKVTAIGDNAFKNCTSIKNVTVPDGIKTVGRGAFSGCTELKTIVIPQGVKTLSEVFEGCSKLQNVSLPSSITYLGTDTFRDCTSLESIVLPEKLKTINNYVFYGCTNLESVIIPEGTVNIGNSAFYGCESLESIVIPDSVNQISEKAFSGTAYYNNADNWENGVLYIGKHLIDANEELTGNYTVKTGTKSIAARAFEFSKKLTGVTIPDGISRIELYTFRGCTELTDVSIPDSVEVIESNAFSDCKALKSVVFPHSVTNIGANAFENCATLTAVEIPESVKKLGDYAFNGCTNLADITLPDFIEEIGDSTFDRTAAYNNPDNWENGLFYIGDYLISANNKLTGRLNIREGTRIIAGGAFLLCEKITYITIPEGVISLGNSAFSGCSDLIEVTIPESVKFMGEFVFSHCYDLKKIEIPEGVTEIGEYSFYCCRKLKSIVIPKSVTAVGRNAFSTCDTLSDVYYAGSPGEWNNISIDVENSPLTSAKLHYGYGCKHSELVPLREVEATCTAYGRTGGKKCAYCETVVEYQKVILPKPHSYKTVITKATLTKNGKSVTSCAACGKVSKTFTVYSPKKYELSVDTYYYNGKSRTPSVKVYNSKSEALKEGTDYKVSYSDNKNIGTASVKITFTGNYSGTKTVNFKIVLGKPGGLSATQTTTTVKLSWNKVTGADGYKIYYYDDNGILQYTRTTKSLSYTFKDFKAGSGCSFRIKAYKKVNGKTLWSAASKEFFTTTCPKAPTVKVTAGTKKATLSWNKLNGAQGYIVYMSESKDKGYKRIKTLEGIANIKTSKTGLTSGKTYYFKVKAYKKTAGVTVYSPISAVKSVKVK